MKIINLIWLYWMHHVLQLEQLENTLKYFLNQNGPDFASLNQLQKNLLEKSSKLIKNKGKIIYMVCSFFYSETIEIIENFLKKNKNFSIERYTPNKEFSDLKHLISKEGYFLTLPTNYKNFNIDGFFSVQLIRND